MRTFKAGDKIVKASHLWKTHPVARGSRRFTFIFRLCRLVAVNGDQATIRLSGSSRKRTVEAASLIDLDRVNPRHYELSL
jgi:hypothetical protein